jgi:archaellum component FlaG (FlaF/FlaG flagellin family)
LTTSGAPWSEILRFDLSLIYAAAVLAELCGYRKHFVVGRLATQTSITGFLLAQNLAIINHADEVSPQDIQHI